jgi:hypothetical protein
MRLLLFSPLVLIALSGCKKQYACECTNPGGTQTIFTVNSTRAKAEEKCKAYYDDNFSAIPWNETLCQIK